MVDRRSFLRMVNVLNEHSAQLLIRTMKKRCGVRNIHLERGPFLDILATEIVIYKT